MNIFLNYYSISLFLGGFIALISGIIVYANDKERRENKWWLLLNVASSVWSFGYFFMITSTNKDIAIISNVVLHWGAIFIPFFYLLFILRITDTYKHLRWLVYLLVPVVIFFLSVSTSTYFIDDVYPKFIFNYAPNAGPLYTYFTTYFFSVNIIASYVLLHKIAFSQTEEKQKMKFILFSSVAGFAGGGGVFFLTFNLNIPPHLIILFALYPMIIAYAIIRHHLFNIKLIATELLIISLWILILVRTFLSETLEDRIINTGMLIGTFIIGGLLVRSVIKEVKTRENFEKLANELEAANEQLRFLDQQKSEFISIASHQLRSPLTAIRGYASMVLEGSFGKIDDSTKMAVERINKSCEHLVAIVEDLLNVSRIEQGRMQYNFEKTDIYLMTRDIVESLEPNAQAKDLSLEFTTDDHNLYEANTDEKIRQVILNLVDNAIKYTEKGFVKVKLSKNDEKSKLILSVTDSGIGISPELKSKLFEKFSRGTGVSKLHANGSGLGLYIAKNIVEAHGGKVWIESPGEGKGSTFFMELSTA